MTRRDWNASYTRFANLNKRDVVLRFHIGNVILELDNDFDQTHDRVVDFVIRAVQLSRGRRLKKKKSFNDYDPFSAKNTLAARLISLF